MLCVLPSSLLAYQNLINIIRFSPLSVSRKGQGGGGGCKGVVEERGGYIRVEVKEGKNGRRGEMSRGWKSERKRENERNKTWMKAKEVRRGAEGWNVERTEEHVEERKLKKKMWMKAEEVSRGGDVEGIEDCVKERKWKKKDVEGSKES